MNSIEFIDQVVKSNPMAINALEILKDFIVKGYPIEKKNLLTQRVDGNIYLTNLTSVVWRVKKKSNEIIPEVSPLSIYVFKNESNYILEQRIDFPNIAITKLRKYDFKIIIEAFVSALNPSSTYYALKEENILYDVHALKILNIDLSPGSELDQMKSLYKFMQRESKRNNIEVPYTLLPSHNLRSFQKIIKKKNKFHVNFNFIYVSLVSPGHMKVNTLKGDPEEMNEAYQVPTYQADLSNNLILLKNVKGIRDYTITSGFINDLLRSGQPFPRHILNTFNILVTAIDEVKPYNKEYSLYRGTLEKIREGEIFTDPGFMSKTSDLRATILFGSTGQTLKIIYPPGIKQLFIEPVSNYEGELEYLTFPGEVIEYRGVYKDLSFDDPITVCNYLKHDYLTPLIDYERDLRFYRAIKPYLETFFNQDNINSLYRTDKIRDVYDDLYIMFENEHKTIITLNDVNYVIGNNLIEGPKDKPNLLINGNEEVLLSHMDSLIEIPKVLDLLNYELQLNNVISQRSGKYVNIINELLDQMEAPKVPYVLYASAINNYYNVKKIERIGEYKIPIYYPAGVKQLFYPEGFITYPGEDIINNEHRGYSFVMPKINKNIDFVIDKEISFFVQNVINFRILGIWIKTKEGLIHEKDIFNMYNLIFTLFRMDKVEKLGFDLLIHPEE